MDEEATAALNEDTWVDADALSILLSPSVPVGHVVEGKYSRLRYPNQSTDGLFASDQVGSEEELSESDEVGVGYSVNGATVIQAGVYAGNSEGKMLHMLSLSRGMDILTQL